MQYQKEKASPKDGPTHGPSNKLTQLSDLWNRVSVTEKKKDTSAFFQRDVERPMDRWKEREE